MERAISDVEQKPGEPADSEDDVYAGFPPAFGAASRWSASLRLCDEQISREVQFQVGFIPDLRFKFGILRGPDESNQVRIRYVGGVLSGFVFNNSLLGRAG
ncbi:hypothetical protein AK812_SmicGene32206 [Symbiodinium microadriaticum]|uniref:Uncharacterized protein n=1 Tax=Symbiodinium microadriaticum TaxID=2951 RepID=A0A1Q9CUP9_SYMMI|nr:hypothetical protein AK812_SmicGene32206 [Symbiodinium microadriaticum]